MPTFRIPNNGQVRQLNQGDLYGELWSTWNIDLATSPGKIKLARPMKQVATSAQVGDDDVVALAVYNQKAYAVTAQTLYSASAPFTSWSSESSTPNRAEDMIVFRNALVITQSTNLDTYDGSTYTQGWWSARGNPLLTTNNPVVTVPHILEVIRIGSETLAVTDGDEVHAYTGALTSGSGTSVTVDLDAGSVATCIKAAIRKVWIGTYTKDADQAYVFEWDGASTNYTQAFPVGAKAVLAMELVDDVPVIVTERGEIKKFNYAGFTTVAQFPFALLPKFAQGGQTGQIEANNLTRPIHPKGMRRQGNQLYIAVAFQDTSTDLGMDERTPNGIWALDLETFSLTHRASPGNYQVFESSFPILTMNNSNGRILSGGRLKTSSSPYGIWLEDLSDSTAHHGYFTTPELQSGSVKDTYPASIAKALLGADDSVRVKYRTSRDTTMPVTVADMTWASTTQLNSTSSSLAAVKTRYDAGHRDEVEVVAGSGLVRLAHITKVEKSSSTYVITVDEAIGTTGETATVRFDAWKKIDKTMDSGDGEVVRFGTGGEASAWAQFKVELRGKAGNPTIREILIPTASKESL